MSRPRLLFVSPYFPDPEGGGPMRRAHAVLSALVRHHDVMLLTVAGAWHHPDADTVPQGCVARAHLPADRELGPLWRWRRKLSLRRPGMHALLFDTPLDWGAPSRKRLALAAELSGETRFDVIHAFRLVIAPYALAAADARSPRPKLHIDLDDVESTTRERIAAITPSSRREHINARAYARKERELLPLFDRIYVGSQDDTTLVAHARREVRILPNTVPIPDTQTAPPAGETHRLLFIGSLSYEPNDDAVRWFCEAILPSLLSARRCEFVVAGRGASPDLVRFLAGRPGVVFLGEVARAAPVFTDAHSVVAPLRAGGGTRIKILEAFAASRPVVSTALGAEGIDATPGEHFVAADTAADFTAACMRMIDDASLRTRLAAASFRFVSDRHTPAALDAALA